MKAQAYPLQWPDHIPRTVKREKSRFKTTLHGALKNVQTSIRQFAADSGKEASNIVVSSNVSLGQDRPADPGVAIWFSWDGMSICIPVDRYLTAADNLQAIHHVLEARRTELRHGTLHLVRATFKGFAALPAPNAQGKTKMSWWQVLELDGPDASSAAVEAAYRRLAKIRHPDAGGSTEAMAALNAARMEAQQR